MYTKNLHDSLPRTLPCGPDISDCCPYNTKYTGTSKGMTPARTN